MICSTCCHPTDRSHCKYLACPPVPTIWCFFCFLAWYDYGLVTEETIRRRSMALREEGWPGR